MGCVTAKGNTNPQERRESAYCEKGRGRGERETEETERTKIRKL